ncbi:uncharacterized protein LOC134189149 [Corticium candelabrum]|uniref:uncharacterized protein LOC134189149 n=1 Tax=Corticium candelabrum TaxID=121492 RepID=UPI002E266304|nr:uncharacterized protein LOC134189149 [Corticium candelabrum]
MGIIFSLGSIMFRNETFARKAWRDFGYASSSREFGVHGDHFFSRSYNNLKNWVLFITNPFVATLNRLPRPGSVNQLQITNHSTLSTPLLNNVQKLPTVRVSPICVSSRNISSKVLQDSAYVQEAYARCAGRVEEDMNMLLKIWKSKYGAEEAKARMTARIREAGMERFIKVKVRRH